MMSATQDPPPDAGGEAKRGRRGASGSAQTQMFPRLIG